MTTPSTSGTGATSPAVQSPRPAAPTASHRTGPAPYALGFGGLVLIALCIQGLAVQEVGLGPLKVKFSSSSSGKPGTNGTTNVSSGGTTGGGTAGGGGSTTTPPDETAPDVPDPQPVALTAGPATGQSNGLKVTVEKIVREGSSLQVSVRAVNGTSDNLTLPNTEFFLIDDTGKSYSVRPFGGAWTDSVPAGATVRGRIELAGSPPQAAKTMKAGFSHVFGSFAVESVTVEGIRLR